jgi:hypothetical protein
LDVGGKLNDKTKQSISNLFYMRKLFNSPAILLQLLLLSFLALTSLLVCKTTKMESDSDKKRLKEITYNYLPILIFYYPLLQANHHCVSKQKALECYRLNKKDI